MPRMTESRNMDYKEAQAIRFHKSNQLYHKISKF